MKGGRWLMKVRKTLSLDQEVVQLIRFYSAGLGQSESAFVSMLVKQVDLVANQVIMQSAKEVGGAGQGTES
jgi:hypothetical protein